MQKPMRGKRTSRFEQFVFLSTRLLATHRFICWIASTFSHQTYSLSRFGLAKTFYYLNNRILCTIAHDFLIEIILEAFEY